CLKSRESEAADAEKVQLKSIRRSWASSNSTIPAHSCPKLSRSWIGDPHIDVFWRSFSFLLKRGWPSEGSSNDVMNRG
ncbi:MAG: hypothetical protein ACK6DX_20730, partial [Acidobacteriota bacterium]